MSRVRFPVATSSSSIALSSFRRPFRRARATKEDGLAVRQEDREAVALLTPRSVERASTRPLRTSGGGHGREADAGTTRREDATPGPSVPPPRAASARRRRPTRSRPRNRAASSSLGEEAELGSVGGPERHLAAFRLRQELDLAAVELASGRGRAFPTSCPTPRKQGRARRARARRCRRTTSPRERRGRGRGAPVERLDPWSTRELRRTLQRPGPRRQRSTRADSSG